VISDSRLFRLSVNLRFIASAAKEMANTYTIELKKIEDRKLALLAKKGQEKGQLDQTNNSISATKQQINQTSEEIKKLQVRLQNLNGSLAKLENQAKEHQGALANVDAELFGVGEEIKKLEERERLRREQEAREAEARREQEAREAEARRQEQLRREQESREAEAARQREAEARRQEQLRREQEERQRQINLAAADVFLGKQVSIKTSDGLFLKAMAGKYGNDIHVEKHRKEWETFTVQKLSEGVMAVKTHHGKFIRVRPGEEPKTDPKDKQVSVGLHEIIPGANPGISITVNIPERGRIDQSDKIGDWEKIQLIPNGDGKWKMLSWHNSYLLATPNGVSSTVDASTPYCLFEIAIV